MKRLVTYSGERGLMSEPFMIIRCTFIAHYSGNGIKWTNAKLYGVDKTEKSFLK